MKINEFQSIFSEKEKEININISEDNINKLYKYMNILLEWNEKMNLTAITEENEIIEKHFIDSLTILNYIKEKIRIIDVGTGAGFPGIPVAIVTSNEVTLLDSLNKRVNFLNTVKQELKLTNIKAIHGRAEEIGREKEYRESFDVAVSRAVAPMNVLVEYLLPFVKVGGICICMKGPNVAEELENSKNAISLLGGKYIDTINIKLDGGLMDRNLIIIEKTNKTNIKYPRKAGTPAKQPL